MSNDHEWLNLIEVSGPFLAVPVLRDVFPQGLEALPSGRPQRLRRTYEEWRDAVDMEDLYLPALHAAWIDDVLVTALEMDETVLRQGARRRYRRPDNQAQHECCTARTSHHTPPRLMTVRPDVILTHDEEVTPELADSIKSSTLQTFLVSFEGEETGSVVRPDRYFSR